MAVYALEDSYHVLYRADLLSLYMPQSGHGKSIRNHNAGRASEVSLSPCA